MAFSKHGTMNQQGYDDFQNSQQPDWARISSELLDGNGAIPDQFQGMNDPALVNIDYQIDDVMNFSGSLSQGFLSDLPEDSQELSFSKLAGNADLMNAKNLGMPIDTGSTKIYQDNFAHGSSKTNIMAARQPIVNIGNQGVVPDVSNLVSLICPDTEEITTNDWLGPLNFSVTVAQEQSDRKCLFDPEMNKLFTVIGGTIPFKVQMDFDQAQDINDFIIRTNLIHLDNDTIADPVLRCYKHWGEEQKITGEDKQHRLCHILRPSVEADVQYYQNESTKRCYLAMPLKSPAPGVNYSNRDLSFACLNSCLPIRSAKGGTATKRRMGVLFQLFRKTGEMMGRRLIEVRICSAPYRDYQKERNPKRKSTDDMDAAAPAAKRESIVKEEGETESVPLATAHQRQSSVRCALVGRMELPEENVSSSQDSIYSSADTDMKIHFRPLIQDIQWTLRQKNSKCKELRDYSGHVFQALRIIQGLCKSAKTYDLPTLKEEKEESEQSPDAGFDENNGQV